MNFRLESLPPKANGEEALWHGVDLINDRGRLTTNIIVEVQAIIEGNCAGVRKQSDTVLMNEKLEKLYSDHQKQKVI